MKVVDLRSDTVTVPTLQMRKAMYEAEVGDDVYGEDPTVRRLEEMAAELTGKEAALFVTSGTMGNQLAAMTHTKTGDELICEAESHVYYYELAGLAVLSRVQARTLKGDNGRLTANAVQQAIRSDDIHQPPTTLIWVENTHNRAGGTYYLPSQLAEIKNLAVSHGISVHMDGARLFNAAVAQNIKAADMTQYVDSVMFCLSKGLCAPVGSILAGSKEFIAKARRNRKLLGGGLRQAGILAAAGIVGLTTMVDRLAEDHHHAKVLAQAIADLDLDIDLSTVQTNIILFDVAKKSLTAKKLAADLATFGIRVSEFGEYQVRMVTHHGITLKDVEYTKGALQKCLKG